MSSRGTFPTTRDLDLVEFLLVAGRGKRNKVAPTAYAAGGTEIFIQQIPQGKQALVYELAIVSNTNGEVIVDQEYSDYFEDRQMGAWTQVLIGMFYVDARAAAKTIHVKCQGTGGGIASVSMKWVEW
jgi:hypothetical protein